MCSRIDMYKRSGRGEKRKGRSGRKKRDGKGRRSERNRGFEENK